MDLLRRIPGFPNVLSLLGFPILLLAVACRPETSPSALPKERPPTATMPDPAAASEDQSTATIPGKAPGYPAPPECKALASVSPSPVPAATATRVLIPPPTRREQIILRPPFSEEDLVAAAIDHLARQLGVAPETIALLTLEEVQWDGPLPPCVAPPGPIRPDRAFPPRASAGYRIVLRFGEVEYEYQSARVWLIFCGRSGP